MAKSKSATLVLGSSLKEVVADEKSFLGVLSWACISMPTVSSHPGTVWLSAFAFFFLPNALTAFAWSLSCFLSGTGGAAFVAVASCDCVPLSSLLEVWSERDCAIKLDNVRGLAQRHPVLLICPCSRYLLRSETGMRAILNK